MTIEERILARCNDEWSTNYTDASQITDDIDESYYEGLVSTAKEQQKRDIEKAIEWLKYHITPDTSKIEMVDDSNPGAMSYMSAMKQYAEEVNELTASLKQAMEE